MTNRLKELKTWYKASIEAKKERERIKKELEGRKKSKNISIEEMTNEETLIEKKYHKDKTRLKIS